MGGLFIKDEKGQVVDVFHRASVTNIYEADDHMFTSPVETVVREGASSVLPEAMCSVVSGFAAGVGCESVMGGMFGIVAPDVMVGPDYVISPLDVSPGDLIYVSAGHVFRYKAGLPSMDVNRHYNRLDMYYYGSVSIFPHYHLIVR